MKKIKLMLVMVVLFSLIGCSGSDKKFSFYEGEPSLYAVSGEEAGKAYAIFMEDTVTMASGSTTMHFDYSLGEDEITLTYHGEKETFSLQIDEEDGKIEMRNPNDNNNLVYTFHSLRQECGKRDDDAIPENERYAGIISNNGVADVSTYDGSFDAYRSRATLFSYDFIIEGNIMKLSKNNSDETLELRFEPVDYYDFILYDVSDAESFVFLHMESASGVRCPN